MKRSRLQPQEQQQPSKKRYLAPSAFRPTQTSPIISLFSPSPQNQPLPSPPSLQIHLISCSDSQSQTRISISQPQPNIFPSPQHFFQTSHQPLTPPPPPRNPPYLPPHIPRANAPNSPASLTICPGPVPQIVTVSPGRKFSRSKPSRHAHAGHPFNRRRAADAR